MSHFTVLVIGDDVEKQLAPFQENNMNNCPKEFLEFNDIEDEYREKYKTKTIICIQLADGTIESAYAKQFRNKNYASFISRNQRYTYPEDSKEIKVPFNEYYKTFEEYMDDYVGYEKDEEKGCYGYWENSNAKWDWWTIGGRWNGFFKMKKHALGKMGCDGVIGSHFAHGKGRAAQAYKSDIDFEEMRNQAGERALKEYEKVEKLFGGNIPRILTWKEIIDKEGEYKHLELDAKRKLYNTQDAVKKFDKEIDPWDDLDNYLCTKEEYVNAARNRACTTFALVLDGKWYQKGEMGWWACVSNAKAQEDWNKEFNNLLDTVPDNTLLTLVDCHI